MRLTAKHKRKGIQQLHLGLHSSKQEAQEDTTDHELPYCDRSHNQQAKIGLDPGWERRSRKLGHPSYTYFGLPSETPSVFQRAEVTAAAVVLTYLYMHSWCYY